MTITKNSEAGFLPASRGQVEQSTLYLSSWILSSCLKSRSRVGLVQCLLNTFSLENNLIFCFEKV